GTGGGAGGGSPAGRQAAHARRGLGAGARRPGWPALRVKSLPALPRLHAITDERIARRPDLGEITRQLAGVAGAEQAVHARGRARWGLEHYELAVRLSACPPARLFVNDRLDVALAVGAAGVQLGQGSLTPADARRLNPRWWIGKSVHDLREAEAAHAGRSEERRGGKEWRC